MSKLKFKLHAWSCCFPESSQEHLEIENCLYGKPELANLSPMVKRRMPLVAKAMAALDDEIDGHQLPAVYASKNAELSRTIKLIRQFDQDLSPAMFSMSVNNAIPGLLSVNNKNRHPYTVIDSLSGLLPMAFIEASTLLQSFPQVKVMIFEEKSSDEFSQKFGIQDACFAAAFVISLGDELSLTLKESINPNVALNHIDDGFHTDCIPFFNRQAVTMEQQTRRQHWLWQWC